MRTKRIIARTILSLLLIFLFFAIAYTVAPEVGGLRNAVIDLFLTLVVLGGGIWIIHTLLLWAFEE